MRLHDHVLAEPGVVAEEDRLGRDERHARRHGAVAQAVLDHALGCRELGPVVDAVDLLLRDDGDGRPVTRDSRAISTRSVR